MAFIPILFKLSYSLCAASVQVTEKNNINGIIQQAQSLLLAKSRVFNEEYKKLVGISENNTERLALL